MFSPALTRSPNPKANLPTTPCVKPTKQMATYVATPDNFDAPFDAIQNAVLPFQHSSLYIAAPNTSTTINTSTVKVAKESTEPAPDRIPRAPTALTPEQESAVISRYVVLADQERLLRSNASLNNGSPTSNKHESTEMGRSHSILKAPNEIHQNASTKLQHDISHRISFSPNIPRKQNLPFASNEVPTKKQHVRSDRNSNSINNSIKNQVDESNTLNMPRKSTDSTTTRGVSLEPPWNELSNECLLSTIRPTLPKISSKQ
jgi:hypothetical protein